MQEFLQILEQFGAGGDGDPGNNAVRFLLAAFFWAGLAFISVQQYRRAGNRRDLYVCVAAAVGLSRELLMFLFEYGAYRGWLPMRVSLHIFPPLEHALTDLARVVLGFAFLNFFLTGGRVAQRFLAVGCAVVTLLYLATARPWIAFLEADPRLARGETVEFAFFWGDLAFRSAASLLMAAVLLLLARARWAGARVPLTLFVAFLFLFLDEFLMVANLTLGFLSWRSVFSPLRHNLGLWAIPFFMWVYWSELFRRLLDERARSEGILEAIVDGICIEDGNRHLVYQNAAHRALFGDRLGEVCEGIHDPDDVPAAGSAPAPLALPARRERRLETPNGPRDVEISISPLRDSAGGTIGEIAVARDVTERNREAQERFESEERYRTLVQNIEHGITLIDREHRVVMANATQGRMLRANVAEFPGRHCYEAFHGRAGVCPDCPGAVAMATGEKAVVEKSTLRPDGRVLTVVIQAFPVHGPDGSVQGFIELVEDVTERRKLREERQRLEERVQQAQKMESLGILAGGIAHDFNNLLMGILGNADLALLKSSPESPLRPFLQRIDTAAQRAADLTNQMLAYSGKGRFVVEPINLSRLVEEMGHLLATVTSKHAVVRYRLAEDLPPVEADATQVRQVVMNLITNASDALGDAEGVITVTTGVVETDESYVAADYASDLPPGRRYAYVEVSDTGAGMDVETRGKMFDPFFTTKHTGRGLGLAAALGIVRGHRGGIKVYSEPGQGTTFKVLLPVAEGVAGAAGQRTRPAAESADAWHGTGTVLLVDDEETVRRIARTMLEECGFQVLTAADGVEALEVFRAHSGELAAVLLDMTMPRMGGEEAFREMQRLDPRVPVILSSGYNEQDAVNRFTGKGLAGFISKPYRMQALGARVRAAIAARRQA